MNGTSEDGCRQDAEISDDDHSETTGSVFIKRFIPVMCSVYFVVSLNK